MLWFGFHQDTAGSERFAKLTSHYCRSAGAAILVYDITDFQTFDQLDTSLKTLRDGGALPECVVVVVGTKLDLVEAGLRPRAVPVESGQGYAEHIGAAFMETRYGDCARKRAGKRAGIEAGRARR